MENETKQMCEWDGCDKEAISREVYQGRIINLCKLHAKIHRLQKKVDNNQ